MGYDAFVRCNCWEEGKTKPYPFDFQFEWNEEGFVQIISPECTESFQDERYHEQRHKLKEWMQNACEHTEMEIISTRIANISGMSAFRFQLDNERYPVLSSELPVFNGGYVAPEKVPSLLAEVQEFMTHTELGVVTCLIDSLTYEVIREAQPNRIFAFGRDGGIDFGLDKQGFFISVRPLKGDQYAPLLDAMNEHYQPSKNELFRSIRFEQRPYNQDDVANQKLDNKPFIRSNTDDIELIDLDSGKRLVLPRYDGLTTYIFLEGGKVQPMHPRFVHVEHRSYGAERFEYITKPLIALCHASLETGNRIQWT